MKKQITSDREEMCGKGAYEKTVLYLYPHMKKMAASLETAVGMQARLSYRSQENTEALVGRLLEYGWQSGFLLETERKISEILQGFTREELFVLEYRYFRRKRILREYEGQPAVMSLRTFYRRQHSVLKKFAALLRQRGMDESWFEKNFSGMDWAMTVYKKVRAGKDSFILGKFRNSPLFRREESDGNGKNALPMSV